MRKKYKELLVKVLTEVNKDILRQAIREGFGSFTPTVIEKSVEKTLKVYFKLLREVIGV